MTALDGLLGPQPEWHTDALCGQIGGDAWFPDKGANDDAKAAKATCRRCPVITACLTYAMNNDVRYGIWGGLSDRERQRLRRTRGTPGPGSVTAQRTARDAQIRALAGAGLTGGQIAYRLGVADHIVWRVLRDVA